MDILRRERLAVAIVLALVLLGAVNWIQDPGQARRWLSGMLVLPVLFFGMTLWYAWIRRSPHTPEDEPSRVRLGDHGADVELERRILGLASAAVFLVVGNALPKILTPLSMLPLPLAERVTRARRFVGMVFFNLGIAVTAAFLAAPLAIAKAVERGAMIAGLLTVLGAIVRLVSKVDFRDFIGFFAEWRCSLSGVEPLPRMTALRRRRPVAPGRGSAVVRLQFRGSPTGQVALLVAGRATRVDSCGSLHEPADSRSRWCNSRLACIAR